MREINGLSNGLPFVSLPNQSSAPSADAIQERANRDVEAAADELAIHFATLLVKEMRSSLGEGLFGSGPGTDTFEGWFDDHLGRAVAKGDGLDLVGMVQAATKSRDGQAGLGGNQ